MPPPRETIIRCAGQCGAKATVVEPPTDRPLLRAIAGVVQGLELMLGRDWEFDAASKSWFCVHCRVRRRLLKVLH